MKMICINCPRGCELDVERSADGTVAVSGNACPRGEEYGRSELVNPTRMVTGLVRVAGMRKPLPVKTKTAVPKGKIDAVLFAMHQTTVQLPVKIGDVVIPDVAGTGVDVTATANM
jgi:CxxC motif-containing protein